MEFKSMPSNIKEKLNQQIVTGKGYIHYAIIKTLHLGTIDQLSEIQVIV
jgi:hypothetical protein